MTPTPDDYIIIDTPELKRLFEPKQATDEFLLPQSNIWHGVHDNGLFGRESACPGTELTYRRLRSRAWLPVKDKPVQYPAWLLHEDGRVEWKNQWHSSPLPNAYHFTHWQPAPAAPQGPVDEDERAQRAAWINTPEGICPIDAFKSGWLAALKHRDKEGNK